MRIKVTSDATQTRDRLNTAASQFRTMNVLLAQALVLIFQTIQRKFQTAGAEDGSDWAPLKPATLARKRKLGQSVMPLVGTGALRQQWDFDSVGTRVATLRSRVPYSGYHEDGTAHLPKRQISPQEARMREIGVRVGVEFITKVLT